MPAVARNDRRVPAPDAWGSGGGPAGSRRL